MLPSAPKSSAGSSVAGKTKSMASVAFAGRASPEIARDVAAYARGPRMTLENVLTGMDLQSADNATPPTVVPLTTGSAAAHVPPLPLIPVAAPLTLAVFSAPPPNVTPPTVMPAVAQTIVTRCGGPHGDAAPNKSSASADAAGSAATACDFGAWRLISLCVPTLQPAAATPAPAAPKAIRRRRRRSGARRTKRSEK
jgi:hypothetical protein